MKSNIKGLLKSDWFHAKLVTIETEVDSDVDDFVWVIDAGEHAYRVIKDSFSNSTHGTERLKRVAGSINQEFEERCDLIGVRAKIRVDRRTDRNFMKNFIMEYSKPEVPQDFNVQAEKTDDHFFTETKREVRKLPI